jgi:hypothetical protein
MRRLALLLLCLLALPLATSPAPAQQPSRPGGAAGGSPGGAPPPIVLPMGPDRMINVTNRTTQAVTTLYVSSTTEDNWGSNRLTIPNIAPARSFQLRLAGRDCKFDVQVVYADSKIEEKRDQDLCRNRQVTFDGSQARLPGQERTVTVMNRAPRAIKQVFISARGANSWGDDLLSRGELETGDDTDVRFRGPCVNDIRVIFDNNSAEERRDVDFCERTTAYVAPGWTTTDEMPTSASDMPSQVAGGGMEAFTIVNETGTTINELYIYPRNRTEQGPDLLGSDTLDADARSTVRVARGDECRFRLRAVFEGPRDDLQRDEVDLCAGDEIRLTEREAGGATATPRRDSARRGGAQGDIPAGMSRLRNAGQADLMALFADPVGTERSVDRLGSDTVEPGEAFDLAPPVAGQCNYTLVALYRDGRKAEANADLCGGKEITLP